MNHLIRMLGFSILGSLYLTIIFVLGQVAPFLFICALIAWLIIRQPIAFPDNANADIDKLSEGTGKMMRKLAEILIYPLVNLR